MFYELASGDYTVTPTGISSCAFPHRFRRLFNYFKSLALSNLKTNKKLLALKPVGYKLKILQTFFSFRKANKFSESQQLS
jgi:hypothetical protein